MPAYKKMTPAEIKAAQERIRALMGGKKPEQKQALRPRALTRQSIAEVNERIGAVKETIKVTQGLLEHARKFNYPKERIAERQKEIAELQKELTELEGKK